MAESEAWGSAARAVHCEMVAWPLKWRKKATSSVSLSQPAAPPGDYPRWSWVFAFLVCPRSSWVFAFRTWEDCGCAVASRLLEQLRRAVRAESWVRRGVKMCACRGSGRGCFALQQLFRRVGRFHAGVRQEGAQFGKEP